MAEIKLEHISKTFDQKVVGLEDFNLSAKSGEFVTILGPSGSGKSTALRIIAGLEVQDEGSVFIDGQKVNNLAPQQRDVAFVFQSYALYPHMNVYENIVVGLRIKGLSRLEAHARAEEVVELLEIHPLLKRMPKQLSGGQKQRVALARAIAKRPKVFLLDEPLSNLDAFLRERMRMELKALFNKLRATVIYVTHDQTEAQSLSDKIVLIDKGEVQQEGASDALYSSPENLFVASFLGSPRINTLEVDVEGQDFAYGAARWKIPQAYLPKTKGAESLIMGIRPEDVKIHLESKQHCFYAKIFVIEKIGKYVILNLDWQGQIIKAVVAKDYISGYNKEKLWIEFDESKIFLFNKATKEIV